MERVVHQRLQLLSNGCTVGVFQLNETSRLSLILSSTGEFTHIRHGDSESVHLTRFVSQKYSKFIFELLRFRNRHSCRPYVCERFSNIDDELVDSVRDELMQQYPLRFEHAANTSAVKIIWTHPQPLVTKSGWKCYISDNNMNMLCLCPTGRRLLAFLQLYYDAEDVCERGAYGAPLHAGSMRACYDVDNLPPDLKKLVDQLVSSESRDLPVSCLPILSKRCGAEDAHKAMLQFKEVSPLAENLATLDDYPFAPVLLEKINDDELFLKLGHAKEVPAVEAWLGTEGDPGIICLRGDVATHFAGSTPPMEMHLSLLLSEGGYDVHRSCGGSLRTGAVHRHRDLLMQMLSYRRHAVTMSSIYCHQPPLPSLGILPEAKEPTCFTERFAAGQTKYYVRVIHGKQLFRGVFEDGFMISLDPASETVDVITPDGNNNCLTLPLLKSASPQLRNHCSQLQSFAKWYFKSPEERQLVTQTFREGADLARWSCYGHMHQVNMELIWNGSLDAIEGAELSSCFERSFNCFRRK